MSLTDGETTEKYAYDKRGNLTEHLRNGALVNQYLYGALNRLEKAVNGKSVEASYQYNGLGYRTGKSIRESLPDPEKQVRYTIDLTRQYHNLLQKEEEGEILSFLWDGGAAGMRRTMAGGAETEGIRPESQGYYLQDDLGSSIRLLSESGELTESYGYDEFGRDLYGNQGEVQPFGYTGYQYDRVSDTYFAQAREYVPGIGRFAGWDIIKGSTDIPYGLNGYGYCWGNPLTFLDLNGAWPEWVENVAKVGGTLLLVGAAVGITVATFGTAAGVAVAATAAIGGTIGGISSIQSGGNVADGIMRGGTMATIAAVSTIANPVGAGLGVFCQLSTDLVRQEISSPEAYTGAMLGGAVGMNTGIAWQGASVATLTGELLESVNGVKEHEPIDILMDTVITGTIAEGVHGILPIIEFDVRYYLDKVVSNYVKDWIDSIGSGIINGLYYEIKDCIDN